MHVTVFNHVFHINFDVFSCMFVNLAVSCNFNLKSLPDNLVITRRFVVDVRGLEFDSFAGISLNCYEWKVYQKHIIELEKPDECWDALGLCFAIKVLFCS